MPTRQKRATSKAKPPAPLPPPAVGPASPDSMSPEVIEFITAIDDYKRKRGRPFPNWSEVLEILKALGYARTGA